MLGQWKRIGSVCAALGLVMAVGARAEAASINGDITFGGVIGPMNFLSDDAINVLTDTAQVTCAPPSLCTGDYAALNGSNVTASYYDFTFDPLPPGGYVPLWTFAAGGTTYSFDLLSINNIIRAADGIIITGTGMAHITGLDSTVASWSFSADSTGIFAFSSTTSVPDSGSTLALLGSLLVGVGIARRRFSRR